MRDMLVAFRGARTQSEMAKLYGVTQQAWCTWENGSCCPNVITMKKLEVDSGIPMEQLFFDLFNNDNLLIQPPGGTKERKGENNDL